MSSTTPLHVAAAALLLALAACNLQKLDVSDSLVPAAVAGAMELPPLAQELHKMFDDEKRGATFSELPTQF
jgi:hypothetical protein